MAQGGRAWAIKEQALKLWTYRSETWARKYSKRWYFWATHSRLEPMIPVAKTMKPHLDGILTSKSLAGVNAHPSGVPFVSPSLAIDTHMGGPEGHGH